MRYEWTSVTGETKYKESPLRRHLDTRFPNTRPLSNSYREESGPIQVELGDVSPRAAGTLGAAYDYSVRFELDHSYAPIAAILPAVTDFQSHHQVVLDLIDTARKSHGETELRACWALALWTEITRIGTRALDFETPLSRLRDGHQFSHDEMMSLLPTAVLDPLSRLMDLTQENLFPHLDRGGLTLGPTFSGSSLCTADADLISAGFLVDLKTRQGPMNPRTGIRHDQAKGVELYQLLCYALWDLEDEYGINEVGMYAARYGVLHRWQLTEFMSTMALREVDLTEERSLIRDLLENPPDE